MKAIKTELEGVVILEPEIHRDSRGYFFESWTQRDADRLIGPVTFVQENESRSTAGVVRGLHFQRPPHAQAKLVGVVSGRVLDVAVDLRAGSPTYGRWIAVELSDENHRRLFIPRGFAHGYSVLSPEATFTYKCDNYYAPESEGGIAWNDPDLAIDWQTADSEPIISEKDRHHGAWADFDTPFSLQLQKNEQAI